MGKVLTHSEKETFQEGFEFASKLKINPRKAVVVFLSGELGCGKTVFVRGFLRFFGVRRVLSPTFVLVKKYKIKKESLDVYHLDAYRLNHKAKADILWEDMVSHPRSVVLVEWASRLGVSGCDWAVSIKHGKSENDRVIVLKKGKNG
jgi:tRNA threonylcarbamoyladenosine biosynthesis protein TsaE